ncbi:cytochrome c3 family protein [Novipirellula caenicola]
MRRSNRTARWGLLVALCGCSSSEPTTTATSFPGAADWQTTEQLVRVSAPANATSTASPIAESAASVAIQQLPKGTVGTQTCAACHPSQYESYLESSHARSAREIANSTLQAEAEWKHPQSGRIYEVNGTSSTMTHRETVPGTNTLVRWMQEADLTYEFGSGTTAHTYLFRDGAFVCESPLTWYAKTCDWDLSPGYEPRSPIMFSRVVTTGCVYCHVGSIDVVNQNPNQFIVREPAIGCERCHGAGATHAKKHQSLDQNAAIVDDIVNPARLARRESEAVCSQCHLQGALFVTAAGKDVWDFRPGDRLSDTRTDFKVANQGDGLRIVGHTEQLHASRCYQNSATLTCIDCHDPHRHNQGDVQRDRYRDACLQCHGDANCGIDQIQRQRTNANDCSDCHMPKGETNVTHAALHHHTIGVHRQSYQRIQQTPPENAHFASNLGDGDGGSAVYPITPDRQLSAAEQDRRWALAVHHLVFNDRHDDAILQELARAKRVLLDLHRGGLDDREVRAALAKDYLDAGMLEPAKQLATMIVENEPSASDAKISAIDVLAQIAFRQQDNATAMQWYQELTKYRRVAGDHYLLGVCQINAEQLDEAIASLRQALRIAPNLVVAHEQIAVLLDYQGESDQAAAHRIAVRDLRAATP